MSSPDAKAEYDLKKKFLEDIKGLEKGILEDMFRVIKTNNIEYSENSNGIFFDLAPLESSVFNQLQECILRNQQQKLLEKERNVIVESMLHKTPSKD
jgi:hypothetical protein